LLRRCLSHPLCITLFQAVSLASLVASAFSPAEALRLLEALTATAPPETAALRTSGAGRCGLHWPAYFLVLYTQARASQPLPAAPVHDSGAGSDSPDAPDSPRKAGGSGAAELNRAWLSRLWWLTLRFQAADDAEIQPRPPNASTPAERPSSAAVPTLARALAKCWDLPAVRNVA